MEVVDLRGRLVVVAVIDFDVPIGAAAFRDQGEHSLQI